MYCVEKFLPTHCPKCQHAFRGEGVDYSRFFGDTSKRKVMIVVQSAISCDQIICLKCQNVTARFMLEYWQVRDHKKAKNFERQGFANLREVIGFGSHTEDRHVVYVVAKE